MPPSQVDRQTLYEADYLRWIETTVEKLRSHDYTNVSKIHIFIDGTWLFKVRGAGAALSYTTDSPTYPFLIYWNKFYSYLRQPTEQQSNTHIELCERFFCTSIFNLPNDFDD